jgi:hypothetical protein
LSKKKKEAISSDVRAKKDSLFIWKLNDRPGLGSLAVQTQVASLPAGQVCESGSAGTADKCEVRFPGI